MQGQRVPVAKRQSLILCSTKPTTGAEPPRTRLGDYQGAIADYDRALELNPQFAQAYYNRGNAKRTLKDYQGAIADYDKAIELNPRFAQAYYNRGVAKSDLGNYLGWSCRL